MKKYIFIFITIIFLSITNVYAAEREVINSYYDNSTGISFVVYKENNILYYDSNTSKKGLYTIAGDTYLLYNDGKLGRGFKTINNKLYYFNSKGKSISKGLINYNGYYYYIKDYKLIKGFYVINYKKYYFNQYGRALTGFQTINNKKYYFNSSAQMIKYFINISGNNYYFGSDGIMKTGFQTINKNLYYFSSTGIMQKGFKTINYKVYYFNTSGISKTGLIYYNKKYYYLYNYHLLKSTFKTIGNYKYYFKKDNTAAIGFITINNKKYYFNSYGRMLKSFRTINNNTYYFGADGVMYTGKKLIKGIYYNFQTTGVMVNGFKTINNETYYYDANNNKVIGWVYIVNNKYFFNSKGQLIKKNAKKVLDVSAWQGEIDWDKVKKYGDIDAVIVRIGGTFTGSLNQFEDSYFKTNITKLKELGIPFGIYFYGCPRTSAIATKEANFVINILAKYEITYLAYPIFYDAEEADISRTKYEEAIPIFNNKMIEYGYKAGVYGNAWALSNSYLNSSKIKAYNIWVAQWATKCTYSGDYVGWQYTSDGTVSGISGRVDISVW